jgi:hypothetical protein
MSEGSRNTRRPYPSFSPRLQYGRLLAQALSLARGTQAAYERAAGVFPLAHPDFALDDDKVSHGARLWANVLGLMAAHAWLEQGNRKVVELPSGEAAIEAIPDDYEVACTIFTAICRRTVVNLSENHRKILGALHDLHQEFPSREGFSHREIASGAGVSPQTVSNNKTFLVTSAKLLKETEDGLALPEGADPSWWSTNELSTGLPTPDMVRSWWEEAPPDPPSDTLGNWTNLRKRTRNPMSMRKFCPARRWTDAGHV